jgi:hypothetical protein
MKPLLLMLLTATSLATKPYNAHSVGISQIPFPSIQNRNTPERLHLEEISNLRKVRSVEEEQPIHSNNYGASIANQQLVGLGIDMQEISRMEMNTNGSPVRNRKVGQPNRPKKKRKKASKKLSPNSESQSFDTDQGNLYQIPHNAMEWAQDPRSLSSPLYFELDSDETPTTGEAFFADLPSPRSPWTPITPEDLEDAFPSSIKSDYGLDSDGASAGASLKALYPDFTKVEHYPLPSADKKPPRGNGFTESKAIAYQWRDQNGIPQPSARKLRL